MTQDDYDRIRAIIVKQYEEDLAALDRVFYRLLRGYDKDASLDTAEPAETDKMYGPPYPDDIRTHLKKLSYILPVEFTKRDVQEALISNFPDVFPTSSQDSWIFKQRVSQTLAKLAAGESGGFLVKVRVEAARVGVGRRCSVYQFDPTCTPFKDEESQLGASPPVVSSE